MGELRRQRRFLKSHDVTVIKEVCHSIAWFIIYSAPTLVGCFFLLST
jgi:hypothetical protein